MESWLGYCPVCEKPTEFVAHGSWYRDLLVCTSCPQGSVPRERALALILNEVSPHWRDKIIHESSPSDRGISAKLRSEAPKYIATQFFPGEERGSQFNGFRNEDLQDMTFGDDEHDLFVSLDVFEHIPFPDRALKEIYRTLKPGGSMVCTFPVRKNQEEALIRRVDYDDNGNEIYVLPEEWHGNPVDQKGSIVTVDYGYEFHKLFATWAPFSVRVYRFDDKYNGIVGEYTEVIVCTKQGGALDS